MRSPLPDPIDAGLRRARVPSFRHDGDVSLTVPEFIMSAPANVPAMTATPDVESIRVAGAATSRF
jgi:hypothetical protein